MIESVCVCGAGTMGRGIAQLCAMNGFFTVLYDVLTPALETAKEKLEKDFTQLVEKHKITITEKEQALSRIHFTSDTNDCIADIIIEAIVENAAIKIGLLNQLAEVNHSETIFATNTSSLSVSEIANGVQHPQRVAGLHFFNPAPIMKLVEIVKGIQTSEHTIGILTAFTTQLQKTSVLCKDAPGFIVNRVARPYYIEALRIVEEGNTSITTIDALLESTGFKMGPFKLMDLIGNDINYAVSCSVYNQLQQPERLKPSYIQQQKVAQGALGRKTGEGYYKYTQEV